MPQRVTNPMDAEALPRISHGGAVTEEMQVSVYTLADLENARRELERWQERWADSSSNNPDKHEGAIRAARRLVREIEDALKDAGTIPLTEQERLEQELDRIFPSARSQEVVEFEGRRYQRIFFPLEKSRSRKRVTAWGQEWRLVNE